MAMDATNEDRTEARQLTLGFGDDLKAARDSASAERSGTGRGIRRRTARSVWEVTDEPSPPSSNIARLLELRESVGYDELGLRWRRCTSWLAQAEQEIRGQQYDEAFIFCWIAFNAAYSVDTPDPRESFELESIRRYFALLRTLDNDRTIEEALFDTGNRWRQIEEILDNHFIYAPYWNSQKDDSPESIWRDSLSRSRERVTRARVNRDVQPVLEEMFSRLYVLRNQLVHGAATYNGSLNRRQVQWGAALLYLLLPVFLDLMFRNPDAGWGVPKYPAPNRGPQ